MTTTTKEGTMEKVGQKIAEQIGNKAFTMMGASNLMIAENGLQWKIGRNPKGVTHITVTLDPTNTYTVKFQKVTRKYNVIDIATFEDVYTYMLHTTIEQTTGLYLSL
jgi:hypothetical protein